MHRSAGALAQWAHQLSDPKGGNDDRCRKTHRKTIQSERQREESRHAVQRKKKRDKQDRKDKKDKKDKKDRKDKKDGKEKKEKKEKKDRSAQYRKNKQDRKTSN